MVNTLLQLFVMHLTMKLATLDPLKKGSNNTNGSEVGEDSTDAENLIERTEAFL